MLIVASAGNEEAYICLLHTFWFGVCGCMWYETTTRGFWKCHMPKARVASRKVLLPSPSSDMVVTTSILA